MSALHLNLPDQLRAYAEARVKSGEYPSVEAYLSALVRRDRDVIDELLREAEESGPVEPLDMAQIRAKAAVRLKELKSPG